MLAVLGHFPELHVRATSHDFSGLGSRSFISAASIRIRAALRIAACQWKSARFPRRRCEGIARRARGVLLLGVGELGVCVCV